MHTEIHVLRKWRKEHAVTQAELARRAHVAHQLISRIELGETRPSIDTAKRLEQAIGGAYRWHEIMDDCGGVAT